MRRPSWTLLRVLLLPPFCPSVLEPYRYAALFQLESHSQSFSHKHIGIMTREKCPFQFLQLPAIEVGPAPSPLAPTFVRFPIATFLLVILVGMIGTVMKMMGGRMVASYRRHQGVVPQCRMRMMRMMMTEEPDSGSRRLMLGLHRLLYLALYLAEDRMMGWPSCQVERKHGCRPLEQPGRCQQGTTGTGGTATRRQWEGQTTSWLQDHVWYQRGDCFSLRWRDLTYFASISFRAR